MKKREIFPLWRHRTVAMYYVLSTIYECWFVAGVWVFIWGMFMTGREIGISDSITFTLGLLIELPSGAIADMLGRKRTVIIGNILMVVGNFLIAMSGSFLGFTLWYGMWTIGYAFQSGATEALVYDYIKSIKKEEEWSRVRATASMLGAAVYPICIAVGGILFSIWFRLPYLALGTIGIVGIIAALFLREGSVHTKTAFSVASYVAKMRDGMAVLFRKAILPMTLTALSAMILHVLFVWGQLRPYTIERFGFSHEQTPQIIAVAAVCSALVLLASSWLQKRFGLNRLIFAWAFLYAALFTTFVLPYGWQIGGVAIILAAVLGSLMPQFFSVFINKHAHGEHRATTLSAVALITRAPYAFLAILIGFLAERNLLAQLSFILGLLLLGAVVAGYTAYRRQSTSI